MNIEINIFTVLEKDLKNVSERKRESLPKGNAEIETGMAESPALGGGKQTAKTWFGLEK
jgi:hypothetical protein